jgi:hypothetical protein
MAGIGADPEGIDNNPAYWQLLFDSAWQAAPVNTKKVRFYRRGVHAAAAAIAPT